MQKIGAVEWFARRISHGGLVSKKQFNELLEQAKEMEREQTGYSEEDVIKIVEKSRETGLTAEYLLLSFKSEQKNN